MLSRAVRPSNVIGVIDGLRLSGHLPVHSDCITSAPGVDSPDARNSPYHVGVRSCLVPHRNTYEPSPCVRLLAM